jgi:putative effector of murein hydrolase
MNLFFILKNYVGVTVGVTVGVFVAVIVGVGVGVTHNENTPFIVPLANNSITTWS